MFKNMKNKMLFSICVPVYNVEKYLHECIQSLQCQTYDDFEIILVDDGSTDNSYQICIDYQSRDHRIKAFTKANGGQISAREFAFERVSGDVILCVDSDDFIEANTLEVLNKYFENENTDCIYFNWQRTYNGKILNNKKIIEQQEIIVGQSNILKKVCSNAYYNSMCLKAFKKKFLPKRKLNDFYKIRHGEDLIQTLDVLESVQSVLFIPEVLYNYRINTQSVSFNYSIEKYRIENAVRPYVYSYLKKKNIFSKKDWDDYGLYCSEVHFENIYNISIINAAMRDKKECFEDIRKSQYFTDYLCNRRTKKCLRDIVIFLFEKKLDTAVIWTCSLLKKIKNIKNIPN